MLNEDAKWVFMQYMTIQTPFIRTCECSTKPLTWAHWKNLREARLRSLRNREESSEEGSADSEDNDEEQQEPVADSSRRARRRTRQASSSSDTSSHTASGSRMHPVMEEFVCRMTHDVSLLREQMTRMQPYVLPDMEPEFYTETETAAQERADGVLIG